MAGYAATFTYIFLAPQIMFYYVGHAPSQAPILQYWENGIELFRAVQEGMPSKLCLDGFGTSEKVCYKNCVKMVVASPDRDAHGIPFRTSYDRLSTNFIIAYLLGRPETIQTPLV